MRTAPLLAALLLPTLSGCALTPSHMLGADGPTYEHPWHQWPARVGMFVVTVPLTIVVAPLALAEEALTGNSLFQKQRPGVTSYMVGVPASVGAYVTGLPFFVLGLPWEFGEKVEAPMPVDDDDDTGD